MGNKFFSQPLFYSPSTKQTYLPCNRIRPSDVIYFDSTFECEVYRKLICLVGCENVKVQIPLQIKPPTSNYPAIHWRCDFRILKPSHPREYINVEAKGIPTREFKRNLQYLELFSPDEFSRLMIIQCGKNIQSIDTCIKSWPLASAIKHLACIGYTIYGFPKTS